MDTRKLLAHDQPKPHQVRGRQIEDTREKEFDERIVHHRRTLDTPRKKTSRAGTISQGMRDAAKGAEAAFIVAGPKPAPPAADPLGAGHGELNERWLCGWQCRRRGHVESRRQLRVACREP